MATYYVDYEGGNDSNDGLSFAQRKKTITDATTGRSAGDVIRVMGSPAETSLAQAGTWTHTNKTVTLTTAVTQSISDCDSLWTTSTNVTTSTNTSTFKQGTGSQQFAVGASFGTGKASRLATGTLDLSGYQQVSFWIQQTLGTLLATGGMSIRLCSDTLGNTPVDTIAIPALTGGSLSGWYAFTVDTGGALGSAIQSVALYVDTDVGAQTVLLDNIMAVKSVASDDSLSLTSLIGNAESLEDNDTWYAVASILGTTVMLDGGADATPPSQRGWASRVMPINFSTNATPININCTNHGFTTGDTVVIAGHVVNTAANGGWTITVVDDDNFTLNTSVGNGVGGDTGSVWGNVVSRTVWKRQAIRTDNVAAASTVVQSIASSGSSGNPIIISGGWDRTDMSTQTLETWFSAQCAFGLALNTPNSTAWVNLSNIGFVRYGSTVVQILTANNCTFNFLAINNGSGTGFSVATPEKITVTVNAIAGSTTGATILATSSNFTFGLINGNGNSTSLIGNNCNYTIGSSASNGSVVYSAIEGSLTITGGVVNINSGVVITGRGRVKVRLIAVCTTGLAWSSGFSGTNLWEVNIDDCTTGIFLGSGIFYLKNSLIDATTPVSYTSYANARIYSFDDQHVTGNFKIYTDGGAIVNDDSVVHTPGGKSWKTSPTSTIRDSFYPLDLILARFTVLEGVTYTVKGWTRRDSITTLNSQLLIKANQLDGVNETSVTASGVVDTWEQLTLATFTPEEDGIIELTGRVWDGNGTTNNVWFDDITVVIS